MKRKKLTKLIIATIAGIAVLAIVGIVGALNGWFGGGAKIPKDTFTRGLVGYWNFEEGSGTTTYDQSDYANNGTLTYMATSTNAWTKGKVGGALNFDGSDDYVSASSTGFNPTQSFTVEGWVKGDSFAAESAQSRHTVAQQDGTGTGRSLLYIDSTTNKARSYIGNTATEGPTTLSTGIWYHLAVVYDSGTGKLTIYTNSVVGTPNSVTPEAATGNFIIGAHKTTTSGRWDGLIDEVRIYSRALTAAEIRYHHNQGGPVAHWKFDEGSGSTAYDSTDNNNDGTLNLGTSGNTSTSSAWVTGKHSSALSFDGVDDYVSCGSGPAITGTTTFSVGAWIKTSTAAAQTIVNQRSTASADGSYSLVANATGTVHFEVYNAGYGFSLDSVRTIDDGSWHHIVGIRTNSTDGEIYIDGNFDKSGTGTARSLNQVAVAIGRWQGGGNYFKGIIDDVRIYNYARTPEEIRLDYNAGLAARFGPSSTCDDDPGSCMTKGLAGYWNFEEGSGTTTYDQSDYSNNGTLTNMATSTNAWTTGKVGGALNLDGNGDYVNVGNGSSIRIFGASFTISMWIKTSTVKTWSGFYVRSGGPYAQYVMSSTGTQRVEHNGGNFDSNTAITDGAWHHIAVVYNTGDSNRVTFYLDGVSDGTTTGITFTAGTTESYYIGAERGAGASYCLNGLIDEVRIYSRALSAAEIRYHYNRGAPVAYWKFDEGSGSTAYDSTDNNNDGALGAGTAAYQPTWVTGRHGTALSFDGSNDYVKVNDSTSLGFSSSTITVAAWVKFSSIPSGAVQIVTKQYQTGNTREFSLSKPSGSNRMDFAVNSSGTSGGWVTASSTTSMLSGVWYHFVGLNDGTNIKMYVNGELKDTQTGTSTIYNGSAPLSIGAYIGDGTSNTNNFPGIIDDVRIYNYARTPEEIRLDYNAGLAARFGPSSTCDDDPGSCMTKGLAGYWNFEEGSGTTTYDQSDYSNNGTLTYMATSTNAWTKGKVGGALNFDGTDDYVQVSDHPALDPGTQSFTTEAWIKTSSSATSTIFDKYGLHNESAGDNTYWRFQILPTGYLSALIRDSTDSTSQTLTDDTTQVNNGSWRYVALVIDKESTMFRIFVDGKEVKTATLTETGTFNSNDHLHIGITGTYNASTHSNPFTGPIDEARIYSRALSAAEIRYHYNRGAPVAYWKFDEGSGSTAYDSTDNNNDGTLNLGTSGNTSTSSAWVTGKHSSALSFDGTDDYVSVSNSSVINFASSSDFTVSAWVKIPSTQPDTAYTSNCIIEKWEGGSVGYPYVIRLNNQTSANNGKIIAARYDGTNNPAMTATVALNDNQFHHLVFLKNGSTLYLYIDGAFNNSTTDTTTGTTTNTHKLYIGERGNSTVRFKGIVDDVRIYNYARTQAQILQDYNFGKAVHFK